MLSPGEVEWNEVDDEHRRWWNELSGAQELDELERSFCWLLPVTLAEVVSSTGRDGTSVDTFQAAAFETATGRLLTTGVGRDVEAAEWDRMEKLLRLAGVEHVELGITQWRPPE